MLVFDIETGPLADETLQQFCPEFVAPPHPGTFDPAAVKCGNLKDETKRAEKIEACRLAHEAAVKEYDQIVAAAKAAHWTNFASKAALDPTTGQVLAIGFQSDKGVGIEDGKGDEAAVLAAFWKKYAACRAARRSLVGCNILGFDLPFLIRRSWILGVDFPSTVMDGNWRYFDPLFVDLRQRWLIGQRWGDCPSSLDVMARALGVGKKPEGVNGGDFAKLWKGTAEEREKARAYLLNDLAMTAKVAERLGIL